MIYLDNCSTTIPRDEVINIMTKALRDDFGNPSSLHKLGIRTEKKIKEARDNIGKYLGVKDKEIFFTSGGTESNNIAIQSIVKKLGKRGNHIITTKIEHPSVLNIMKYYEKIGFDITYLDVDRSGFISLEEFKASLKDKTILVSIMHVNNEIGTIQPIGEMKRIMEELGSIALFHVDGVQSFGKIEFTLRNLGVDTYSFSSHKVHGPKGIGGLYVKEGTNLEPITYGGNQESGLRSGTENVPGIIGFGKAVEILGNRFLEEKRHIEDIGKYFIKQLKENIEDIKINSSTGQNSSPYIFNISFRNTRGEVLLHYLEDKDIYVSTTSACSSKGTEINHVLTSIGLSNNEIEGTLRFCLDFRIQRKDIDYTIKVLKDSVEEIRQIMMR